MLGSFLGFSLKRKEKRAAAPGFGALCVRYVVKTLRNPWPDTDLVISKLKEKRQLPLNCLQVIQTGGCNTFFAGML